MSSSHHQQGEPVGPRSRQDSVDPTRSACTTTPARATAKGGGGGGGGGRKKTRFDGLDVARMTSHVNRHLLGQKLVNVYDGASSTGDAVGGGADNKCYLFKLASTGGTGGGGTANRDDGATAEGGTGSKREHLLMESGVRFHTTSHHRSAGNAAAMPSPFAMKLRKHLRNLRLEGARQLGLLDRVVDFRFGSGEGTHHVLLELYSSGNLILTDGNYRILALLRSHDYKVAATVKDGEEKKHEDGGGGKEGDGGEGEGVVKVGVGQIYPVTLATTLSATDAGASTAGDGGGDGVDASDEGRRKTSLLDMNGEEGLEWARRELRQVADHHAMQQQQSSHGANTESNQSSKKGKKKGGKKGGGGGKGKKRGGGDGGLVLKVLLLKQSSGVHHYGPSLVEHCILSAGLEPHMSLNVDNVGDLLPPSTFDVLMKNLREEGGKVISSLESGEGKGYVLYQPREASADGDKGGQGGSQPPAESESSAAVPHGDKVFLEFQPHLLLQHASLPHVEYPTFSAAVDEYFSLLGGQRQLRKAEAAESAARDKLDRIRRDQAGRMDALVRERERLREHAALVEVHAADVDRALGVVNEALDHGMGWDELRQLVEVEQAQGNPVALLVHRLDLENDAVVLSLDDVDAATEEGTIDGDGGSGRTNVTVSIHLSAHGNAREMYDRYRQAKEKFDKTAEASTKALKAAEATAQKQLREALERRRVVTASAAGTRKPHWFEKFHWFVTSDNYLVVAGRDAQQNELVVKRYLRPGDAYLHADVHGAASCILRAKRRRRRDGRTEPIPLSDVALREAGNFTICRSAAWSSKMVTSAWWVEAHQVSKTAPTGEYLTTGSFMVRGKKNFLPASQLEMGLGVLFRLGDDSSVARHANERRDFALLQEEEGDKEGGDVEKIDLDQVGRHHRRDGELDSNGEDLLVSMKKLGMAPKAGVVDEAELVQAERDVGEDLVREGLASTRPADKENEKSEIDQSNVARERKAEDETGSAADGAEDGVGLEDDELKKGNGSRKEAASGEDSPVDGITQKAREDIQDSSKKKKKGLSARDRKMIKKYGSLEAAEEAARVRAIEEEARLKTANATNTSKSEQEGDGQSPVKSNSDGGRGSRRKKTKMKKAAKKYADQDDDDRALAMLALHGGEKSSSDAKSTVVNSESLTQRQAASDTAALLVRDPSLVAEKLPKEVFDVLSECVAVKVTSGGSALNSNADDVEMAEIRWDKFDADVLEQMCGLDSIDAQLAASRRLLALSKSTRVDNFSASLSGIIRTIKKYGHENLGEADDSNVGEVSKQRKTKAEKQAEREEWREILAEDGILDDGDDGNAAIDDTAELSKLTGKPLEEDVLLYAMPVCAPYQSLTQYKYRVKLTPGSQKRGKASKQCVEIFVRSDGGQSDSGKRCRDLIKLVSDNEWVQAMCGDVKISAPGASKVAKRQKAHKKGGKKK